MLLLELDEVIGYPAQSLVGDAYLHLDLFLLLRVEAVVVELFVYFVHLLVELLLFLLLYLLEVLGEPSHHTGVRDFPPDILFETLGFDFGDIVLEEKSPEIGVGLSHSAEDLFGFVLVRGGLHRQP